MDAVRKHTHYPSDPSRATRPPRSASPTDAGGRLRTPLENASSTKCGSGQDLLPKKPQEAQKAKAFWKMKAAKDAGEEYHDPEREDNILGRNKT